jgi:thymidylate synthase
MIGTYATANEAWLETIREVNMYGHEVAPRGMPCKELLAYKSTLMMRYPIVSIPARKLGYKFQAAEAAWILSGDNRVETIAPYSKAIARFSDDGIRYFGAYGPRVIDQIAGVAKAIANDPDTRQAVMTIWRSNPPATKDVPCTVSIQWLVRDGKLHCIDTMRSSDTWLGWPYDVFNFSMLTGYLALYLRRVYGVSYDLGSLSLVAGSQHIYKTNEAEIALALQSTENPVAYEPFDPLTWFVEPDELTAALWQAAEGKGSLYAMSGREL